MRGPDFVIIGAMKCGTSTLAAQLGAQKGIFMTTPKEPCYFSDDAIYARGPDWYASLFDDAAPGDIAGEASTHYTKRPDLPRTVERMAPALPRARLVYMIRDPMARIVSHYIHDWSEGKLSVPITTALDSHPALVDYGYYGMQIAPFVDAWGVEAICLTSLERLRANPDAELRRIATHLGHEGPVAWQKDDAAQNVSAARSRKLPLHGLIVDHPMATAIRRAIVPKALRTWVRQARQIGDRPEIPADRADDLRKSFAADRRDLAAFFPGDPSLDLAYPWLREAAA